MQTPNVLLYNREQMSLFEGLLLGKEIAAVHVDSEVTYLMLADGTQVTVHGLVVVEPPGQARAMGASA
jgi:hypothetical protein